MQDTFAHFKPQKTVFKRTRPLPHLPKLVLYVERHGGQQKCKVLDAEGGEHMLDDRVLLSDYKVVSGAQAEALIGEHWASVAPKTLPHIAPKPAPEPVRKPAPKAAPKAAAKAAPKAASKAHAKPVRKAPAKAKKARAKK